MTLVVFKMKNRYISRECDLREKMENMKDDKKSYGYESQSLFVYINKFNIDDGILSEFNDGMGRRDRWRWFLNWWWCQDDFERFWDLNDDKITWEILIREKNYNTHRRNYKRKLDPHPHTKPIFDVNPWLVMLDSLQIRPILLITNSFTLSLTFSLGSIFIYWSLKYWLHFNICYCPMVFQIEFSWLTSWGVWEVLYGRDWGLML